MITLRRALRPAVPLLAAGALTAGALAGCGSDSGGGSDGGTDPASVVPASSPAFAAVTVRPQGEERANVEKVARALFDTDDPGAAIVKALERGDRGGTGGLDFEEDVEPWLGDRVGLAATSAAGTSADGLLVAASRDDEEARKALDRAGDLDREATYKDVEYRRSADGEKAAAVLDGAVVFGGEAGVRRAIDVQKGAPSLADASGYRDARAQVPGDGLGVGYLDVAGVVKAAAKAGGQGGNAALLQSLAGDQATAIAGALQVGGDDLRIEAAATGGTAPEKSPEEGEAAAAVAALPADAWLGAGIGDIRLTIENALTGLSEGAPGGAIGTAALLGQVRAATGLDVERDLLAWMGRGAIFVSGSSLGDVGGGLIAQSTDPAATRRAVRRLGVVLPRLLSGATVRPLRAAGVDAGVTIRDGSMDVHLAAAGDRFILAVGEPALRAALDGGETLGATAGYRDMAARLGADTKPSFYADATRIATLAENLAGGDPQSREALDVLRRLTQIGAGGTRQGDTQRVSVVVGVQD